MAARVLIVEDQRIPREYMERLVNDHEGIELAGSITSADLALTVCMQKPVELILMDVLTAGNKTGLDAAAEVKKTFPQVKIIIVTSMIEVSYLELAHAAHVDGFWYKDASEEELSSLIDRVLAGEKVFPDKTPTVKIGLASSDDFTPGELRVLRLICNGLSYEEIADQLSISASAVKYHVSNILAKTGFTSKIALAVAVINQHFIIPDNL